MSAVQLLHLQYFKLLAENEHLLNTAKMIHISAPALSTTISKLEKELGPGKTVVTVLPDTGERYFSTQLFSFDNIKF